MEQRSDGRPTALPVPVAGGPESGPEGVQRSACIQGNPFFPAGLREFSSSRAASRHASRSRPVLNDGSAEPRTRVKPRKPLVVVIDPGHGGKDPGAVSPDGTVKEKDVALAVSRRSGSVAGGVLLLLFGALIFLHTALDVSMEWIEDVWPIVPMGLGAYLIYRGIQDRQRQE